MSARLPRLLDANLHEVARVTPMEQSVTLDFEGISSAQLTLAEDAPPLRMHDWFEVYTPAGSAGMFRVTDIDDTKRRELVLTLTHGIDTLRDSLWRAQEDFDGTVRGFLTQLLSYQQVTMWQLGTCEDDGDWKRGGLNYDRLSDLLAELREDRIDYYLDYDFSTTPWTLNVLERSDVVTSEFRLSRNVESCRITYSDAEQCNKLYLSINEKVTEDGVTTTETTMRVYNNNPSQAQYGIIEKTADIDLENVVSANDWGFQFIKLRKDPAVAISIEGYALKQLTGEDWDEAKLGQLARVALPDYGTTLEERVVTITYPEIRFEEGAGIDRVTVELANRLAKFSETLAKIGDEAEKAAKGARGAGRGGASANELKEWSMVITEHGDVLDTTGVTELYESGIVIDSHGTRIFSLYQGYSALSSAIDVQAGRIDLVVTGDGATASINIEAIVDGINDASSQITISADKIFLDGTTSVESLLTGRASMSKIWADDADFGDLSILTNGSLSINDGDFNFERKAVSWLSKSVLTGAGSSPTTTVSNEYWFVVAWNNDLNDLRTIKGRLVYSYSGGSAATSDTIYYLGRAQQ